MEDVLADLIANNQPTACPLDEATEEQIIQVEEEILLPIPAEMREFILHTNHIICGSLEPITVTDPYAHNYISEVTAEAWQQGLPREFFPICVNQGQYYVMGEDAEVKLWSLEQDMTIDEWKSIWIWARDVWLES